MTRPPSPCLHGLTTGCIAGDSESSAEADRFRESLRCDDELMTEERP